MIGLVAILLQALLPATFIGGIAGLRTADLLEHGPDLMHRIFVLAGMVLGLMIMSLISMLLVLGISALMSSKKTRTWAETVKNIIRI